MSCLETGLTKLEAQLQRRKTTYLYRPGIKNMNILRREKSTVMQQTDMLELRLVLSAIIDEQELTSRLDSRTLRIR